MGGLVHKYVGRRAVGWMCWLDGRVGGWAVGWMC
jgi:hypothetical protein